MDFSIKRTVARLCYGQTEVLRLICELPVGDTPMEQHLRALSDELSDYAKQAIQPQAQSQLECAIGQGRGHTFFAHRFRIFATCEQVHGGFLVTLFAEHTRGRDGCSIEQIVMYWSADAAVQRPISRLRKAKKRPHRAMRVAK